MYVLRVCVHVFMCVSGSMARTKMWCMDMDASAWD